jgi:hypothetical protein
MGGSGTKKKRAAISGKNPASRSDSGMLDAIPRI